MRLSQRQRAFLDATQPGEAYRTSDYADITGVVVRQAQRDLAELTEYGLFQKRGKGRATRAFRAGDVQHAADAIVALRVPVRGAIQDGDERLNRIGGHVQLGHDRAVHEFWDGKFRDRLLIRVADDSFPKYRKHRASGQAIVTLAGIDHYLGPYGRSHSSPRSFCGCFISAIPKR